MDYCEVCGKPEPQLHHVIYRSIAPYMANIPINFMWLCLDHHTGKLGPHLNKGLDLKYKLEIQKKLFSKFTDKNYYTLKEIAEILDIREKEAFKIVKTLKLHKEGFDKLDVIVRCMGGKLYAK